jgi:tetratricopeptide (TPR) repeat protein
LELCELVQQTPNVIRGLWYRGVIQYYRGQIEEGLADYRKALNLISEIDEPRIRWGVLFNLGSLQLAAERDEEALHTYRETAMLLLDMVEEMQKGQQAAFLMSEEKFNVFRAMQALAERTGQLDSVVPLLKRLPVGITIDTGAPIPQFYWGGGEWM